MSLSIKILFIQICILLIVFDCKAQNLKYSQLDQEVTFTQGRAIDEKRIIFSKPEFIPPDVFGQGARIVQFDVIQPKWDYIDYYTGENLFLTQALNRRNVYEKIFYQLIINASPQQDIQVANEIRSQIFRLGHTGLDITNVVLPTEYTGLLSELSNSFSLSSEILKAYTSVKKSESEALIAYSALSAVTNTRINVLDDELKQIIDPEMRYGFELAKERIESMQRETWEQLKKQVLIGDISSQAGEKITNSLVNSIFGSGIKAVLSGSGAIAGFTAYALPATMVWSMSRLREKHFIEAETILSATIDNNHLRSFTGSNNSEFYDSMSSKAQSIIINNAKKYATLIDPNLTFWGGNSGHYYRNISKNYPGYETKIFQDISTEEKNNEWNQYRGNSQNTGSNTSIDRAVGKKVWRFKTEGRVPSSASIHDGILYIGSLDHNLYAIDAKTGQEIWRYKTSNVIYSSPAISEDIVYIASRDGVVYALNASDGSKIWSFQTKSRIIASPKVYGQYVFIGNINGEFYALNKHSGDLFWQIHSTGAIYSTPAILDDKIYLADDSGKIQSIDLFSGNILWAYDKVDAVRTTPAISNNNIYVTAKYRLYSINILNGLLNWEKKFDKEITSSPTINDGIIFVGSHMHLYAIDTVNGTVKWDFQTGYSSYFTSPVVSNNYLFIVGGFTYSGAIIAIDINSREELWRFKTGGQIRSNPSLYSNKIFVGSSDGYVYAIE